MANLRKNVKMRDKSVVGKSWNNVQDPLPFDPKLDFPQLGETSHQSMSVCTEAVRAGPFSNNDNGIPKLSDTPKIKKSKRPILFDFTKFVKPKEKTNQRKIIISKSRLTKTENALAGNILDSSKPIRKKGKCRERKKIKLSLLKTNIIKDRILKSLSSNDTSIDVGSLDFKKEIAQYLETLKIKQEIIKSIPPKASTRKKENIRTTFSSKFRWYCENALTESLNGSVSVLIKRLVDLQDRAFERDPVRARAHKRFITGLREAKKYLKLQKVKLLIIAPDLETSDPNGSLAVYIKELKAEAHIKNVSCAFALDRRKLGYCSLRKAPVSVFAVINYEGAENEYRNVIEALEEARYIFENTKQNSVLDDELNDLSEIFGSLAPNDEGNQNAVSALLDELSMNDKKEDADVV